MPLLLLSLLQTSLLLAPRPSLAAVPWRQDEFFISFWVGPQVPVGELDARIAEVAEANFTGFLGFNGTRAEGAYEPAHPARVQAEVDACARHGLRCVPSLCGVVPGRLPLDKSNRTCLSIGAGAAHFWGFQLVDEPSPGDFSALAEWSEAITAARPDALRFFNLLPSAELSMFPHLRDYEAYVSNFTRAVKPQVLSMDFYTTFGSGSGAGRCSPWPGMPPSAPGSQCPERAQDANGDCRESKWMYSANLAVLRRQAEHAPGGPIPFWTFFNAMPFDSKHADPTEAMIRWQAMTAVTWGASGVMYFCCECAHACSGRSNSACLPSSLINVCHA